MEDSKKVSKQNLEEAYNQLGISEQDYDIIAVRKMDGGKQTVEGVDELDIMKTGLGNGLQEAFQRAEQQRQDKAEVDDFIEFAMKRNQADELKNCVNEQYKEE